MDKKCVILLYLVQEMSLTVRLLDRLTCLDLPVKTFKRNRWTPVSRKHVAICKNKCAMRRFKSFNLKLLNHLFYFIYASIYKFGAITKISKALRHIPGQMSEWTLDSYNAAIISNFNEKKTVFLIILDKSRAVIYLLFSQNLRLLLELLYRHAKCRIGLLCIG